MQNNFERHNAVKADLTGAVNHTHAASSDLIEKFVITERERLFVLRRSRVSEDEPAHAARAQTGRRSVQQRRIAVSAFCPGGHHKVPDRFVHLIKKIPLNALSTFQKNSRLAASGRLLT